MELKIYKIKNQYFNMKNINQNRYFLRRGILISLLIYSLTLSSKNIELLSPNGKLNLKVDIDKETISWNVSLNGNKMIEKTIISMDFTTGVKIGIKPKLSNTSFKKISQEIVPAIPTKDAILHDECNQLELAFKGNYKLLFRAYNDGIAYRFIDGNKTNRNVVNEQMDITFPKGTTSFFPKEESMYSHNERLYLNKSINELQDSDFCSLPVMFVQSSAKILFTETDLCNYPGMFLKGDEGETMHTKFPHYVLETKPAEPWADRNEILTKTADYIAKAEGARTYPWRVFIISDDDRTFVKSSLSYQLAHEQVIQNTNWIKPGQVAWDWYNANNIYGVDFKSGLNTQTYKYYIDFASKNHIQYVILDEGWTKTTTDIMNFNPEMDVKELIKYAEGKNVNIILWVLWKPLDQNTDQILDTYKSWGVKGIKVDFIQRSDQYVVSSYERIAKKCADRQLMVDFHGAFKPSGLSRKYPNVINYEGVKGAENNKWSKDITPHHNLNLPFIRMAAGPLDYTPGAMVNKNDTNFSISFERPMSQGTRSHQVAMYVVYEAPLQMLCESPARYNQEQPTVNFITQIPTVWDETVVLHGKVGNYIAIARRKGDDWYIGAMTDWTARDLEINLSFLKDNCKYNMQVYKDGINADRYAEDYKIEEMNVDSKSRVVATMASGGGWCAILKSN